MIYCCGMLSCPPFICSFGRCNTIMQQVGGFLCYLCRCLLFLALWCVCARDGYYCFADFAKKSADAFKKDAGTFGQDSGTFEQHSGGFGQDDSMFEKDAGTFGWLGLVMFFLRALVR